MNNQGTSQNTQVEEQFPFDEEFEQKLLAHLIRDKEFFDRNSLLIKGGYFVNNMREDIYNLTSQCVEKYGEFPTKEALRNEITQMFIARKKKDVPIDMYFELLDNLFSCTLNEGEATYSQDKIVEFAQNVEMRSVLKNGANRVVEGKDLRPILTNVTKALEVENKNIWDVLTADQIRNMKNPTPLFEGFNMYEGCFYMLTGSGGDFKSLVSLSFIRSVVGGYPLFGKFKTLQTGPVILIDEETPEPIMKPRIINCGLLQPVEDGNLHILHLKGFKIYDPDDDTWFNVLVRNADRIKPKLIIFDSLTRLHNEDEIKATRGMAPVMDRFRQITKRRYSVLLIHHFNKSEVKTARGSTDIPNAVDFEYQCLKTSENTLEFSPGKKRADWFEPLSLTISGLKGLMSNEPIRVTCSGTVSETLEEKVINVLRNTPGIQVSSKDKNVITLETKLLDVSLPKLREAVKSLVEKGLIEAYEGAKPKRGYAPTLYRLKDEAK